MIHRMETAAETTISGDVVPTWTLGDRMAKARDFAGISQLEMAEYLGLKRGTLSDYERGAHPPKLQTLRLWAMRSGVSFSWLIAGDANLTPEQAILTFTCSYLFAGDWPSGNSE